MRNQGYYFSKPYLKSQDLPSLSLFLSIYFIFEKKAIAKDNIIGVIVCKLDKHGLELRGYIAMLAVSQDYRKRGIGSELVRRAVGAMRQENADEV